MILPSITAPKICHLIFEADGADGIVEVVMYLLVLRLMNYSKARDHYPQRDFLQEI